MPNPPLQNPSIAACSDSSMQLFKSFTFEAAHRLPNVPPDHKCARIHGHSFRATTWVEGPVDEHLGWVIDYADIKAAFQPIWEQLDHYCLNEVEGLENPTSENIARWIWTKRKPRLSMLSAVEVAETCDA